MTSSHHSAARRPPADPAARGRRRARILKRAHEGGASVKIEPPPVPGSPGRPEGVSVTTGEDGQDVLEVVCACGRTHTFVMEYEEGPRPAVAAADAERAVRDLG